MVHRERSSYCCVFAGTCIESFPNNGSIRHNIYKYVQDQHRTRNMRRNFGTVALCCVRPTVMFSMQDMPFKFAIISRATLYFPFIISDFMTFS
jgi:hypothetical protein